MGKQNVWSTLHAKTVELVVAKEKGERKKENREKEKEKENREKESWSGGGTTTCRECVHVQHKKM